MLRGMKFKIALVQLRVSVQKDANLLRARSQVLEAARHGANVVVLPECFNSPYGTAHFPAYAEPLAGPTCTALSQIAKDAGVHLIGGSFPELGEGGKLFNTSTVWDPAGTRIGIHRKIHLFDIEVPNGIRFKESDALSAGNEMTMISTPFGRIGLGICYDLRFPELAMCAARADCVLMVYPGAFNMTTGPLHWELLLRARALDNQMFVAACSPARVEDEAKNGGYVAYGHSSVVDPMGKVIATTDGEEGIVYADVDTDAIFAARQAIPVTKQRRFDVYPDISKGP
ncbi:hypothetical protein HDU87_007965 [Geranomyces variabilis]|uniref:CN hydrolase domain-containing protein n=1 Tax=Geranomyces variabilis TaxID=109894 RepID=A0AAD5TR79_9FUNG|nr:hypothetical protein HDU87_007965 [Geranomyces variabilis]